MSRCLPSEVQHECDAEHDELVCNFPDGHDGPHYDKIDNLTWKRGMPDE